MLSISANWLQQNKRLIIITAVCIALAANFWAGSRVPSLNDKASLGGDLVLEDPLGFEAAYPVDPGDPLMERILFTTVNWVLTNRQGMTFGILIAAAFMTILSLLKRRSFSSHFGNTLLGLFIGMPLGVCVNCAAPIARGLHDSGTRLETTLVAMISSPTLNIIVLTMLFSLMPVYMAVTKVAMTLIFLLVLVPLLSRYIFKDQLVAQNITFAGGGSQEPGNSNHCESRPDEPGWLDSTQWVLKKYASNLFYIIKLTVPLMLLAGLMGAVAITLFSWQEMASLIAGNQWYMVVISTLVIAVIGLFLPVPHCFRCCHSDGLISRRGTSCIRNDFVIYPGYFQRVLLLYHMDRHFQKSCIGIKWRAAANGYPVRHCGGTLPGLGRVTSARAI